MQYMKVVDWINKYFIKDLTVEPPILPPSRGTVYSWIEKGKIPGKQIGTQWYVDLEAWELQNNPFAKQDPQSMAYAQRILRQ